ncbi:hypothetical protein I4U23_003296 [Adineta vaga]|nr:hypothetical protein I4U23_003296 [Adineta vaga]
MAIDPIELLVQQIDTLDKELNDLSSAMVAEVQKPDSTAVTVYNINLHFMNKCQERMLNYGQLQGLLTVVLWGYESLISAQNYYLHIFPRANSEFWGTVSAGSAMFLLRIIQLLPQEKNQYLLIFAFAAVGALNTLTESSI